jgi:hypothetical protein
MTDAVRESLLTDVRYSLRQLMAGDTDRAVDALERVEEALARDGEREPADDGSDWLAAEEHWFRHD